jgi:hypothetical protein
MSRDLDSAIATYAEHFKAKVARLKGYELHAEDRLLLKKNILVSVIDAVSRVTSNSADGNRERFTAVVAHFGDWPDHTRVSAPHLSYFLRNLRAPAFSGARQAIAEAIRANSHGGFVPLSADPELDSIRKLWPVPPDQKLVGQLSLSSFTHLNLLYHHRNSLVHELREPGYGMEFHEDHEEPFYHGMTAVGAEGEPGERTLELVYPLKFYFRLTDAVISNVASYLRSNRINPYSAYRFGSSWIGDLNT